MFDEEDLLPISGLRHLAFCERRCALMHVEGLWADNRLTAEGHLLHETSHLPGLESRGNLRIARALRLHSLRLGLSGVADVVEFHRCGDGDVPPGVALPGAQGRWRPYPVEYKRGHPYPEASDEVQLCAQALCLEEMLDVEVPAGALFYGQPHRRHEVSFTQDLRGQTEALATRLHALVAAGRTPPARYEKRCRSCSLLDLCLPKTAGSARSARLYLDRALAHTLQEDSP